MRLKIEILFRPIVIFISFLENSKTKRKNGVKTTRGFRGKKYKRPIISHRANNILKTYVNLQAISSALSLGSSISFCFRDIIELVLRRGLLESPESKLGRI